MKYTIHHFDTISSTNDYAAEPKYSHGDILMADFQTKGRGQRGNTWVSRSGENLTFSLVVEPQELHAASQFCISMATAVAIAQTIRSYGVEGVEVKWPNDILVSGQKIAGILIENHIAGVYLSRSVIGVGINVAQREFPVLETNPTSLFLASGRELSPREVLDEFLSNFTTLYSQMEGEELFEAYCSTLYRREGLYPYQDCATGEEFLASIYSIDSQLGELTLALKDGTCRSYYFKEVKFL